MTGRSAEEAALLARFAQQYAHAQSDPLVRIERTDCACDCGATSWTTQAIGEGLFERELNVAWNTG